MYVVSPARTSRKERGSGEAYSWHARVVKECNKEATYVTQLCQARGK